MSSFKVLLVTLLTLIPLPGPSVFKITCSRDNTRIVRKIIQSKLTPVLEKYNVNLGVDCPFHPSRDIFAPTQSAKHQNRPSQWTCGLCGKSFFEEKFLDLHFGNRHKDIINGAEDAVCLSDYCDILRCDVLLAALDANGSLLGTRVVTTDIEVWNEAAARTAITPAAGHSDPAKRTVVPSTSSRTAARTSSGNSNNKFRVGGNCDRNTKRQRRASHAKDNRSAEKEAETDDEEDEDEEEDYDESVANGEDSCVDKDDQGDSASSVPPVPLDRKQSRLAEMQRMKANCKKEELDVLKVKCQVLIRDCIGGLLVNLSQQEFKEMEDELNRKICWYLSCDRYFEDGAPDRRAFPWILMIVIATILSSGICLCYYIIWVLFDSDDYKYFMINSTSSQALAHHGHSSPTHTRSYLTGQAAMQAQQQNLFNNMILTDHDGLYGTTTTAAAASYPNPTDCLDINSVTTTTAATGGEHYIYVTYPPELKRRLLESCYNRTTRL